MIPSFTVVWRESATLLPTIYFQCLIWFEFQLRLLQEPGYLFYLLVSLLFGTSQLGHAWQKTPIIISAIDSTRYVMISLSLSMLKAPILSQLHVFPYYMFQLRSGSTSCTSPARPTTPSSAPCRMSAAGSPLCQHFCRIYPK